MFKDYKEIFKNLRDVQDQLWKDATAVFPGAAFQESVNQIRQQSFDNVNNLVEQAIGQSLELQQKWLDQWVERASGKKLKPKLFAELSAEARESTQHWLENQQKLMEQWLGLLSGTIPAAQPNFSEWEKTVQESMERQKSLLNDWLELADFKKLSGKEIGNLSEQITKSMQKAIETQQQLWGQWFNEMGALGASGGAVPVADTKKEKRAAAKPKPAAVAAEPASADDLKKISGIGPGLEKKLNDAGITTLKQIAELSDADVADLEERIIRFSGRIKREQWVEQAKKLIS